MIRGPSKGTLILGKRNRSCGGVERPVLRLADVAIATHPFEQYTDCDNPIQGRGLAGRAARVRLARPLGRVVRSGSDDVGNRLQ